MVDFTNLVIQGRAYSALRAWTPEELDALLTLERERGLSRPVAADFIRNGISTLEAYDAAEAASFKPKTLVEAADEADAALKNNEFAVAPEEVVTPAPQEVAPEVEADAPAEVEATVEADAPAEADTATEDAVSEDAPKKGKK